MSEPNAFAKMWSAVTALVTPAPAADTAAPSSRRSLTELVAAFEGTTVADREQECLANAVYFEARGESIEGQLAVAEVVMNRAASGRYPTTLCAVITQKAQFSFIRHGRFPAANRASDAWRKAVAISQIARQKLAASLPTDVLWYHATYVSPKWGKRLNRQTQIGLHIFYS
jgi:spore germination cell wall hydrolase CwlJ-like protein